ncbi:pre-mRNA-splicing factor syf1 homolog [Macrosteles quadrilineatus]|uniref:pre-mRNA-splicing factor syf1 homolog n=1 Tax=Macrosteles quadrilineatus TaxID=74068 RepID=UPI0023E1CCDF|nr:pre-mRNA-splicing factor syf1 homolog [Macrosteles quadrilineatus]XP_054282361.1 pre-mRNA-splicing factor syf1 homolog [Macrosteles quadrilineatus]
MPVYTKKTVDLIFNEEDLPYEEEILRNPFSVKHWLRYIEHKKDAPKNAVNIIYERALKELPGSYKLWYNYLKLRRRQVKGRCITDPSYEDVNNAFERSLVFMHKMPRIWLDYCQFLVDQCLITRTRQVFDRALRALPITQHHRIWPLYLAFLKRHDIPETAVRVFRRYLKLCPEDTEDYIEYLTSIERLDEAAVKLAYIVNKEDFVSKHGKSNHQLWNELCELISKNPDKVRSLNVDAIIRGGLRRYTDQLGHLWNSLADYYVRSGLFERARDIYEEAIQTVTTVRDFTQVFDAYAQFEELSLSKVMEEMSSKTNPTEEDDVEVEIRLARFEHLIERRLLLLNSVLLRQNPHNVHEWLKRVKLYEGKPHDIINTYTEAVQTVDPKLAVGKPHTLWVSFAKFYEAAGQIEDARVVLEKATLVPYVKVDDLASVWCEWAEMEIRHENYDGALRLMQRATVMPARKVAYHDETETVQMRVYKSLKLWSMYADLEESFGTFKSCKSVYDRIIDLKIATPQIIINYGLFLEEHNYFEEAFRAYEKGIALFKWPNVYDIWNTYLTKFLKRYEGTKLERARDLFEQCLENCPAKFAKALYLLYAKLEEDHGLARHAMAVYERATAAVLPEEQFELFNIYIKKAADIYGVPRTRQIYEKAIEVLQEENCREMCLRFAEMETKLGEIDRARAIYAHCSQVCDPRVTADFWQTWKEFEVRHGNEDTMREMLRIKRSVQATYNTQVNMMSAQMLSAASNVSGTVADLAPGAKDGMRMLEAKAAEMAAEDRTAQVKGGNILFVRGETQGQDRDGTDTTRVLNPDEINIDEDDHDVNDSSEEEDDVPVEKQTIPSEVFGSLKKDDEDSS